jgi:phosphate-selective porin OprO/OprP
MRYGFKLVSMILTVACATVTGATQTANADSEALLQLIEVLHENGTINAEAYEALKATAGAEVEAETEPEPETGTPAVIAEDTAPDASDDDDVHVTLGRKGLEVKTADGASSLRIGGRMHLDAAYYDDDGEDMGSGAIVRRARLEFKGKFAHDWQAKSAVDLGLDSVSLKSTYIAYAGYEPAEFLIGNFKEPLGLNELTSSNYSTLMERSQVTQAFAPGRNLGLSSNVLLQHWLVSGGLFAQPTENDDDAGDGWVLTGRVVWTPWREKTRLLHIAASGSYRDLINGDEIRIRARPESRKTDVRLVDTGDMGDVDEQTIWGAELAGVYGPASIQSEYIGTWLDRGNGNENPTFSGWYVLGSYFFTGESRGYDESLGRFTRVKVREPIDEGGRGAWELAFRYSHLDLTDGGVTGGEQDIIALGVNWYATQNLRFMANYVDVIDLDRSGTSTDGDEPQVVQVRTQINF